MARPGMSTKEPDRVNRTKRTVEHCVNVHAKMAVCSVMLRCWCDRAALERINEEWNDSLEGCDQAFQEMRSSDTDGSKATKLMMAQLRYEVVISDVFQMEVAEKMCEDCGINVVREKSKYL